MRILLVAGARPNFVKLYAVYKILKARGISPIILHTGQHYDYELSQAFFEDFQLPKPDIYLGVGSDTNVQQIARIISLSEDVLRDIKPDLVMVFGDVNSTLALAISSKHLNLKLAHVEAGLRSRDWSMPEEINRITTDALSDYLFSPSYDATENLIREGKDPRNIFTVGNIMIDSLTDVLPKAQNIKIWERFGLKEGSYIAVTLHRPSNVDEPNRLKMIISTLNEISRKIPVVFPIHPRTKKSIDMYGINVEFLAVRPLRYSEFLSLMLGSGLVITDSGGVQEETSFLGIPCITLRPNTERPITLILGTNTLLNDVDRLPKLVREKFGKFKETNIPLWDGKTAQRILKILTLLL